MSDEARDLWTAAAQRHGVSVSALLEAMADELPDEPEDVLPPRGRAIIAKARDIDAERRRRG